VQTNEVKKKTEGKSTLVSLVFVCSSAGDGGLVECEVRKQERKKLERQLAVV